MSRSLFIGRWQPFHDGHRALIDSVLSEGKRVLIAVRDTPVAEDNPYSVEYRIGKIREAYADRDLVEVIAIPDIAEVCYGRDVGWGVRHIRLGNEVEKISATKIRNSRKRVIWLTGNTGSGKTSFAVLLKERMKALLLDGDDMRRSISHGLGFSRDDREEHNLRVARLAQQLNGQGFNILVSVIAPFESTRIKITEICDPYWIYIPGGAVGPDTPYEIPAKPHLTINPADSSLLENLERIIHEVGELRK